MKKYLLLAPFFLALTFCSAQTKEEKTLLDLCKIKFQWMIHDRVDSLAGILDDRVKFIHSTGWTETKKELIDDIKSEKLNYQKIDVSALEARVYGSTGVVTGTGVFSGTNTGEPFNVNLMFTEVYVLKGKSWQLVSRHANKMP